MLGIGPGLMWQITKQQALWFNAYTETAVRNRVKNNVVLQAQFATHF